MKPSDIEEQIKKREHEIAVLREVLELLSPNGHERESVPQVTKKIKTRVGYKLRYRGIEAKVLGWLESNKNKKEWVHHREIAFSLFGGQAGRLQKQAVQNACGGAVISGKLERGAPGHYRLALNKAPLKNLEKNNTEVF